jgi:crossover junction endodeoxyribonuclease RuvC
MLILGIDPGTTRIGYGLIESNKGKFLFKKAGIIEIKKKEAGERLVDLEKELSKLIKENKPDKVGVEKLFFSKNKKTAIRVAEARGVILVTLAKKSIPFVEISPNQIKTSVTGYGNASKKGVAKMVSYILKIPTNKYIDDTTDALAIAIAVED